VAALAPAVAIGIAAGIAEMPADAETDRPVFVVVVGHGSIRLRLAAGITAPCDSLENRMLFDGWVGVGRYALATHAGFVCYQHTSGALRESDWSLSRLVPTMTRRGPAVVLISTD
jgi:hypothetical protein